MRMGNQCAIKIAQPPCAPQPKGAVVVYLPPHHTPQKSTSVAGLVFSQRGHIGGGSLAEDWCTSGPCCSTTSYMYFI